VTIILLWLFLRPIPEPYAHLVAGLDHRRYVIREACSSVLDRKMREQGREAAWWTWVASLRARSPEARWRLYALLSSEESPAVRLCQVCGGPRHCKIWTPYCVICGATRWPTVEVGGGLIAMCDSPDRGHTPKLANGCKDCGVDHGALPNGQRICWNCHGAGFRFYRR
jgi:hypothetical protein